MKSLAANVKEGALIYALIMTQQVCVVRCGVLYRTLNNRIRLWRVPSEPEEKERNTESQINCLCCVVGSTAILQWIRVVVFIFGVVA
jgi:hypothetical protein